MSIITKNIDLLSSLKEGDTIRFSFWHVHFTVVSVYHWKDKGRVDLESALQDSISISWREKEIHMRFKTLFLGREMYVSADRALIDHCLKHNPIYSLPPYHPILPNDI